jgi:hypothetical protein
MQCFTPTADEALQGRTKSGDLGSTADHCHESLRSPPIRWPVAIKWNRSRTSSNARPRLRESRRTWRGGKAIGVSFFR